MLRECPWGKSWPESETRISELQGRNGLRGRSLIRLAAPSRHDHTIPMRAGADFRTRASPTGSTDADPRTPSQPSSGTTQGAPAHPTPRARPKHAPSLGQHPDEYTFTGIATMALGGGRTRPWGMNHMQYRAVHSRRATLSQAAEDRLAALGIHESQVWPPAATHVGATVLPHVTAVSGSKSTLRFHAKPLGCTAGGRLRRRLDLSSIGGGAAVCSR